MPNNYSKSLRKGLYVMSYSKSLREGLCCLFGSSVFIGVVTISSAGLVATLSRLFRFR